MLLIENLFLKYKPGKKKAISFSLVRCDCCLRERKMFKPHALHRDNTHRCLSCSRSGKIQNEEWIVKRMLSRKKFYKTHPYPSLGIKRSESFKKKCSLSKIGHKMTEESKNKISIKAKERLKDKTKHPAFGTKWTEERVKGRSGSNHPLWDKSRTSETRIKLRASVQNITWRTSVYKRDNYTCCLSGKRGALNAHHLDGYSWCVDKRFNIDNGITLHTSVHNLFHSIYGKRKNTRIQFDEFRKDYLAGKFTQN